MRNLALKYAILTCKFGTETPFKALTREYAELEPQAAYQRFKVRLPFSAQGVLDFAFSDKALSDIILYEFELNVNADPPDLLFRKTALDAESIRLSAAVCKEFNIRERDLIESLSSWLMDATRGLYKDELSAARQQDIRQEYREMLRLYADKYSKSSPPVLTTLSALPSMVAFTHAMTVDAMFKADAAKLLFGEGSGYHQAWLRKQVFRHMISQAVRQYIQSFAA